MSADANTDSPSTQYNLQKRGYFIEQARDSLSLARRKIARGPISEEERQGIHTLVAISEFNLSRALRDDDSEAGPEGAATTLPAPEPTSDQSKG
jgi:hypothetical protein